MTWLERLAKLEHRFRLTLGMLPSNVATHIFSGGRTWFSQKLADDVCHAQELVSRPVTAWNIRFRMPIWNAAGMFKDGRGYDAMYAQGAGAFVVGTTTGTKRKGNSKLGITWPSVPYPRSRSASNWMGLPNPGHTAVATLVARMPRNPNFPIGASISADPHLDTDKAITALLAGFNAYSLAKADYIELNESCPNVPGSHSAEIDDALVRRLEIVSEKFLRARHRPLPVVVKISNDVLPEQLPTLLQTLINLKYDGIILGNTSTQYKLRRQLINVKERKLYDWFTSNFGGGVSGAALRQTSFQLACSAADIVQKLSPGHEFHVIRCGGVMDHSDILATMQHGVLLHQWYTGYYEQFSQHGHRVYHRLSASIADFLSESNLTDTLS